MKSAIQVWIIFLYVALLLCIIIISVWVFYRNMRPLYILLHWLDSYQTGKKNKPLKNDTRITEFRKLNDAATRYVERTEQMFEQQKQFIGNASHEIQTPLAICRNRLEMLMEDDSLSEKQLEELMKTHQTLKYITKLNKSLLLLSKIDNGQFTDTKEVDLNVLLRQYLEDYKEVYSYKNIEVSITEQANFHITMNESLAIALLTNLLKNAFVHNVDEGHIRIIITKHSITFEIPERSNHWMRLTSLNVSIKDTKRRIYWIRTGNNRFHLPSATVELAILLRTRRTLFRNLQQELEVKQLIKHLPSRARQCAGWQN